MKRILRLAAAALLTIPAFTPASATEWSWDWPISATKDKDTGYANGFYNFSTSYDANITSMERTFNGKKWTVGFRAGAQLAYTTSGQSIGSAQKGTDFFTLSSDSFDGPVESATIEIKTQATDATIAFTAGGTAYECGGTATKAVTGDNTLHAYTFTPADGATQGVVCFRFDAPSANTANYVKKITIVYSERTSTIEAPVFTPEGGVYDNPVQVSLTGPEGAAIIYTLDGSSPLTPGSGIPYEGPFEISQTTKVMAVATLGEESSPVAEATYTIRRPAGLALVKESYTIELLEEDIVLLHNPNNVSPIAYSSSNPGVAYIDKNGHIYTWNLGEAVITVTFAGNNEFTPQTLSVPVSVVAKPAVEGFEVSPEGGEYEGPLTVHVTCTDPRVVTFWYNVGPQPSETDDYGMLEYGQYKVWNGTDMTLTLTEDCVLSVAAMGENLWSEPKFITYRITTPLQADFEAVADAYEVVYHQGFDSVEEANLWSFSQGSEFMVASQSPIQGVPSFSTLNPESTASLYHDWSNEDNTFVAASPVVAVPENAKLRFWLAYNPVWLYYGDIQFFVTEDTEGAEPEMVWSAFRVSQEMATDDTKWNQFYVDLAPYAGKNVYFALAFGTAGDAMMLDDFEVVVPLPATDTIEIEAGSQLSFRDLSTGNPDSWSWTLPGAETESASVQNPTAVYNRPGTYDVTLTVGRGEETSSKTRVAYVKVNGGVPSAAIGLPENIYFSPEAGIVVPLDTELTFTDQSKGAPESWLWTLPGTDLQSAVTKDVTVKYQEAGMYDVDLTVGNAYGTSSTYIYGVKAGGESLIWNIPAKYNGDMEVITMGWYGAYGGTNWLDMDAFAERFDAPVAPATIKGVNVYFGMADYDDPSGELTVAIQLPDAEGLPGQTVAQSKLTLAEIVDASETYNDPTWFAFETPVAVNSAFFVSISGFPNEGYNDAVAMYALRRADGINTAYHLLQETDANYQPTGETKWYAQEDDPVSFAIAPKISFDSPVVGVDNVTDANGNSEWYNLEGIRVEGNNLQRGVYLERRGNNCRKVIK